MSLNFPLTIYYYDAKSFAYSIYAYSAIAKKPSKPDHEASLC